MSRGVSSHTRCDVEQISQRLRCPMSNLTSRVHGRARLVRQYTLML
jgi:hypothetical protein